MLVLATEKPSVIINYELRKKMTDRVASLIVSTDYLKIDVEIEKQKLQHRISKLFPEKAELYDPTDLFIIPARKDENNPPFLQESAFILFYI